jgi:HAD superfamily hydrolase (TIGR01509 family)
VPLEVTTLRPAAQALLFDLGNVLVEVDWNRSFALWSDRSGVSIESIAVRFLPDDAWHAHERGALGDAEFFAGLSRTLGLSLGEEDMLAGWNAALGEPFPGVTELVARAAARIPVYVFSNTNTAHVTHFRPRYRDLFAPVRSVICSCELGARKPDLEAFRQVAAQIGVAPQSILFLDDSEANVSGALAAGMHARHVPSPRELASILGPWTS